MYTEKTRTKAGKHGCRKRVSLSIIGGIISRLSSGELQKSKDLRNYSKSGKKPNIVIWDIESTGLRADFAICLCVGFIGLDGTKAKILSLHDYPTKRYNIYDEKALMRDVYDELSKADLWVTHNGKMFDVKFLQTKMIEAGIGPLPPVPHVDNLYIGRSKLLLHSNRLKSIEDWFVGWTGGKLTGAKTSLQPTEWLGAMAGDKKAFKYITDHCIEDVKVLRDIYKDLRPLLQGHPRLYPWPFCAIDGGAMIPWKERPSGKTTTMISKCVSCGRFETSSKKRDKAVFNG